MMTRSTTRPPWQGRRSPVARAALRRRYARLGDQQAWHEGPGLKLAIGGAGLAVGLLFLWSVRSVLPPFIIAGILAYVLNPVVTGLARRTGLPRVAVLVAIFALLVLGLVWGALVVLPRSLREIQGLAITLPRLARQLSQTLSGQETIAFFGLEVSVRPLGDELTRVVNGLAANLSTYLLHTLVATVETLLKSILALVATFYLLVDADRFSDGLRALAPPRVRRELGPVLARAHGVLGRLIRGELILVAIMTVATWLALTFLGLRYALALGVIAGVLELIPLVGPYLAATPAVALAFVIPSLHGWSPFTNAGAVALTYLVLRLAEDYFVIPQVLGRAVSLHPLLAMFAALCGATLGGVLGMFLAIPLAAVLRIILQYFYAKIIGQPPAGRTKPRPRPVARLTERHTGTPRSSPSPAPVHT